MNHHCGVNAGKCATFEKQNLTTDVQDFLGWRTDDADSEADLIRDFCRGDSGADGHSGDNIVSARVADSREAIVFSANRQMRGPLPALAMNAVGRSNTPLRTSNPLFESISESQVEAFSSSKAISGLA